MCALRKWIGEIETYSTRACSSMTKLTAYRTINFSSFQLRDVNNWEYKCDLVIEIICRCI